MVATFIAWIGANDLDKFVALVGSFACIPLVYIYPVSSHMFLNAEQMHLTDYDQPLIHSKAVAQRRWEQLADFALCVVGLCLMVYTSALTVKSWAMGGGGKATSGVCDGR